MKSLAIAGANLRRFLRERSNVFFVFILPIGIILLVGSQFGSGFQPRLGIVTEDTGNIATAILDGLGAEESLVTVDYDSEESLLVAVERGSINAGVTIPGDADAVVAGGGTAEVGFVSRPDGLGPQMQAVVSEAVERAIEPFAATRFAIGEGADPAAADAAVAAASSQIGEIDVRVVEEGDALFPATLGQFDLGASSALVLFMFLTGLAGSAAVIQTRNLGVATRMVGTPTSVGTIVAGEALGRFVIVLVQGLYIVAATLLIFRVNWGNPLGAAAIILMFAAVGAGAALLAGTLFANDQQAGGIGVVAGLGLAAIGGSMVPLEIFSDTMQTIAKITPHAWANEAFAELVRRDGSIVDILPQLGVLAAFAVGFLLLATWRMRRVITTA